MIPESFIQELLNRLDIVDVVDHLVPLKKAGANYQACCPFHNEKSPSFTVSPTKQFYHCFGCGAHGTAISFVMEYQGLGFVEAIEELAKTAGVSVPHEVSERRRSNEAPGVDLSELMQQSMNFYRSQLKQSELAIEYLKKRGLSGEIAARFGIGYAPASWQSLSAVFPDYQDKHLVQAGLVIEGDEGKRYDRFRDRIMFPIINQRMAVIGFGGRVLGAGEPKYLNSPETPLFEKGKELYGLPQARQAIREKDCVLVVEGYMDVVALAQHGVAYAVATLGTATTPEHVKKLLRQTSNVVFSFDGDAAGRKAAWRALENSLPLLADDKSLKFLFLPQGEDPDSYIRAQGKEAFENLLEEALPLSQFLVRELASRVDMQTQEGRAHLLQMAKPLLQQIGAPTLSLMLRKRLAELAGIEKGELEELYELRKVVKKPVAAPRASRQPASLERKLLRLLLYRPDLARNFDEETAGGLSEMTQAVIDFSRDATIASSAAVLEHFRESPLGKPLQEIAGEILQWGDDFDADGEFADTLVKLRENARKSRIDVLLAKSREQGLDAGEKNLLQLLLRGNVTVASES
ncbi:MAG: DNA primase [Sulfuricella sp.]|nr:DNA primase [Sulfuricella sp.]